jgi:hypothetical protein
LSIIFKIRPRVNSFRKGGEIMKKEFLIVLATVATMVIGLGSLASVQGCEDVVLEIPGITVVHDAKGDLLLSDCDPNNPGIPCSLPPGAPLDLPGYFDIKNATIVQLGPKYVDLFITLYAPIPAKPPEGFVSYIWQFQGGCVNSQPGSKDSISLVWQDWGSGTREWRAYWYEITSCAPRTIARGEPVPFKIIWNGVMVRVLLDDLATAIDPNLGYLEWYAAVRRVPFIYSIFPNTVPVDFAPDVEAFNPSPPPILINPEEPATWEPFSFHR